ncbi:MAG: DUF4846 domain-containing protein [Gorillibacterium sp.]|nr:DUF4846 domain-containing protein [Gorillibacterium sp.]
MAGRTLAQHVALTVTVVILSIVLSSCDSGEREATPYSSNTDSLKTVKPEVASDHTTTGHLATEGLTLDTRIQVPAGYERALATEGSFQAYLRTMKLKPHGAKVHYYNGKVKNKRGVYVAVADIAIGDRDLHQCADAVMLLRAQYLYDQQRYEEIHFNFTNGFKAEYAKWREGYRIAVEGNAVTWVKNGTAGDTEPSFRKFMDMVFAYAGTLSLEQELLPIAQEDMQIGDVFIIGGSPGHAVIVVDMAVNLVSGEKLYLLAQSYTPAQDTQILANPKDKTLSPWYSLQGAKGVQTPEWTFEENTLRRFAGE